MKFPDEDGGVGGVPIWSRRVRRPRRAKEQRGGGEEKSTEEMKRGCCVERRGGEGFGAEWSTRDAGGGGGGGGEARSESGFEIERHNNGGSPTNRRVQFWKWMCFREKH